MALSCVQPQGSPNSAPQCIQMLSLCAKFQLSWSKTVEEDRGDIRMDRQMTAPVPLYVNMAKFWDSIFFHPYSD